MPNFRRVRVEGACYFFTLVTNRRIRILSMPPCLWALGRALGRVRRERPFSLDALVVLPDHLHMLMTLPQGDNDYATRIQWIKRRFTRSVLPHLDETLIKRTSSQESKRESGVWQRRYWEHTIRDEADFTNHLEYIFFNPVKHGLVRRVVDWPHSSFHRYVREGKFPPDWAGAHLGGPGGIHAGE